MGLIAVISSDDLEIPPEVTGMAIVPVDSDDNGTDDTMWNNETEEIVVEVDYTQAFAIFAECFESIAKELVPVDTGYLRSTISSFSDGQSMTAMADAHYAQYVEFGTYKMEAQPYFIPALEQAWDEAAPAFQRAIEEAQQELASIIASIQEGLAEDNSGGFAGGFGGFLGLIFGAIIIGLIQGFFNLLGSTNHYGGGGGSRSGYGVGGGAFDSFVEIV